MSSDYNKLVDVVIEKAKEKLSDKDGITLNQAVSLVVFDLMQSPYFNKMYDYMRLSSADTEHGEEVLMLHNNKLDTFMNRTNDTYAQSINVIYPNHTTERYEDEIFIEAKDKPGEVKIDKKDIKLSLVSNEVAERMSLLEDILVESNSFFEFGDKVCEIVKKDPEFYYYVNYYMDHTYSYYDHHSFLKIAPNFFDDSVIKRERKGKYSDANLKLKKIIYRDVMFKDSMDIRDLFFQELNTLRNEVIKGDINTSRGFWSFLEENNFFDYSSNMFIGGKDPRISYMIKNHEALGNKIQSREDIAQLFEGYQDLYATTLCGKFDNYFSKKNLIHSAVDLVGGAIDEDKLRRQRVADIGKILGEAANDSFFLSAKEKFLSDLRSQNFLSYENKFRDNENVLSRIRDSVVEEFPILGSKPSVEGLSVEVIDREYSIDESGSVNKYVDYDWVRNPETGDYEEVKTEGNPIKGFITSLESFTPLKGDGGDISLITGDRNIPYLDDELIDNKWGGRFVFLYDDLGLAGYAAFYDNYDLSSDRIQRDMNREIIPSTKISYFGVSEMYRDNQDFYDLMLKKIVEHSDDKLLFLDCSNETINEGLLQAVNNIESNKEVLFYLENRFDLNSDSLPKNALKKDLIQDLSGHLISVGEFDSSTIKDIVFSLRSAPLSIVDSLAEEFDKYSWDRSVDKTKQLVGELLEFYHKKRPSIKSRI